MDLKFSIVNTTHPTIELKNLDPSTEVWKVQTQLFNIDDNLWPQSFISKSDVAKMRFFYRGKELKSNMLLKDCGF